MLPRTALILACLLAATPAAGAGFTVATNGALPAVAVGGGGTAHVVWDVTDTRSATSTTHYCRVPRGGSRCAAGSERMFAPTAGDQEFAGPRVVVDGHAVTVVFSRCCSGTSSATRVFVATSRNGGAAFATPAVVGSVGPDLGFAAAGSSLFSLGTVDGGVALQAMKLGATTTEANLVVKQDAASGGFGASPKGRLVAYADAARIVRAASLKGDVLTARPSFTQIARGSDVRVTSGPAGVDILYLAPGDRGRYIVRRCANGRIGHAIPLSAAGPIFGTVFQDAAGRIHGVWIGEDGITYRRSNTHGDAFARFRVLGTVATAAKVADLGVAADASGRATVVYATSATSGRVGGYTLR